MKAGLQLTILAKIIKINAKHHQDNKKVIHKNTLKMRCNVQNLRCKKSHAYNNNDTKKAECKYRSQNALIEYLVN